ncbi:phospholipase D-like domain-containing protein [Geomonas propionica]|uniref:Phospholipase D family protein n=1 Tax=Geomonas propionica TaxID=2798582 RepID=A0ABS0YV22_9BACT|nr:phospholipase D family protein [Geomonas propionica]MBJ6801822.1 phospholipase D family protein [Geomonas propionica]
MDSIEFVSNSLNKGHSHEEVLAKAGTDAESIILCAAYWKPNGIRLIKSQLISALERGVPVEIYASLNEWNTTPEALTELLDLVSQHRGAKLYLCEKKGSIFHTKVYYFRTSSKFTAIIGSANLTEGGLSKNDEASVVVKGGFDTAFHNELLVYLLELKGRKEMVLEATKERIEEYQKEFKKRNDRRVKRGLRPPT